MHMTEWTNIIGNLANPPVPSTPLSPYAHPFQLEKQGCALDGEKVKRVSYIPSLELALMGGGWVDDRILEL
jgi:hypothetical protein